MPGYFDNIKPLDIGVSDKRLFRWLAKAKKATLEGLFAYQTTHIPKDKVWLVGDPASERGWSALKGLGQRPEEETMRSFDVEVWMDEYTYEDESGESQTQKAVMLVPLPKEVRPRLVQAETPSNSYLRRLFREQIDPAVKEAEGQGRENADDLVEFRVSPFPQG